MANISSIGFAGDGSLMRMRHRLAKDQTSAEPITVTDYNAIRAALGISNLAEPPPLSGSEFAFNLEEDFNGVGTGSVDNVIVLQEAVDLCATLGVPLFIPTGVFLTSGQINVPSNITIFGEIGSVIKGTGSFEILLNILSKTNVRLYGFTLDGGTAAVTSGIFLCASSDVWVERLQVKNFTRARTTLLTSGVLMDRATRCHVLDCTFSGNGRNDGAGTVDNGSIMFRSHPTIDSTYCTIARNTVVNAGLWAIGGHDYSYCIIEDNDIDQGNVGNTAWNNGYGVLCYASDHRGQTVSSVDIETEIVTFAQAHGLSTGDLVYVNGVSQPQGVTRYQAYYFRSETATTGKIYDTAEHASAGGSTGLINWVGAGTTVGISHVWHRCIGNRIVKNRVRNCWGMGIYLVAAKDNIVEANDIHRACLSMQGTSLIVAAVTSNTCFRTQVINNTIRECGGTQPAEVTVAGIALAAANADNAHGNTIDGIAGHGIWNGGGLGDGMPGSFYINISDNPLITRTTLAGIKTAYVTVDAQICDNTITGVGSMGIWLQAFSRGLCLGNTVKNWGGGTHGILLENGSGSSQRALLHMNTVIVQGDSVYGSSSRGIYVTSTNCTITTNFVHSTNTLAVGFSDSGGSNTWSHNQVNGTVTTPYNMTAASRIDATGTGSPENVLTAAIGSTYLRTDGGPSSTFYVKESGTGAIGWTAK